MFAATHPERTRALVLYAPLVKGTGTDGLPWALAPELQGMFLDQLPAAWGSEPMARMLVGMVAPSLADDQQFLQFMARAMRSSVSPGAALAWVRMITTSPALPHAPPRRAIAEGASFTVPGR